ncbi:MAG TPA: zf-TFIIB domain-containing protein [Gemmatimonadaceae bacterium]|nr:zf-TFIIB domain-containing protein [Gemmatimonadaceae bacterium]
MNAQTLSCPMCGASAAPDATSCGFCHARLATMSCPSCYGLLFVGSRHCSHCGARAEAPTRRGGAPRRCPRGCGALQAVDLGGLALDECPGCHGTWLDVIPFEQLCASAEQQAAVLAETLAAVPAAAAERVRYSPCAECGKIMNRVNFARSSGIVLDICKTHGVWLDAHELRRLIEFLRAGGLRQAREREKRALDEELRLLRMRQAMARGEQRHYAANDRDEPAADSTLVSIFSLFTT